MHMGRSQIKTCAEFDIAPRLITTGAGRHVLKRLCDEVGIELGDPHDCLLSHSARRGAKLLVRTPGYATVARALDTSKEIVREHYSYTGAGELTDQVPGAFEEADRRSGFNSK